MHKLATLALGTWMVGSGCAPAQVPTLTVHVDADELPADGTTPAQVVVTLDPPTDGVVVRLATGLGALSQTSVPLERGTARVTLWPPFEADLGALPRVKVRVSAEVLLQEGQAPLLAAASYVATPPDVGAPTLVLSADPQRVRADGAESLTVHVVGRRIAPGTSVTIATDEDVGAPLAVTLDDASSAEIVLEPRAEPVAFILTASVDGALPFSIPLAFLSEDAPSFDLTGTFAQIAYGVVEVSGVGISPSPQVVSAPTISKVSITQDDSGFVATYETCAVQMPIVCIAIIGDAEPSTTTPGPGFVGAIPISAMAVPLRGREPGAAFEPDAATLQDALTVGADLDNPGDALPDNEDDSRVTDDDNDGKPGVTVSNSSLDSEQHIVYRTQTTQLRGVIASSDEIDGSEPGALVSGTETKIINADFFTSAFSPEVRGLPSTFRMVRVDGRTGGINIAGNDGVADDVSCADVRQYLADPASVLAPPASDSCAP